MPTFHDGSFKDPLVTGAFKFNMRFKAAVKREVNCNVSRLDHL